MIRLASQPTIPPTTSQMTAPIIINKPVMEFMINLLRRHGFTEIVISTSYLAHDIEPTLWHYARL